MQKLLSRFSLIALMGSTILLSACDSKNNEQKMAPEDQIMQEMSSEQIQNFSKTKDDVHDIKLLIDYDARYSAMTESLESELTQLQKKSSLSADFAYTRKADNILSALDMLKQLDLKTQQGRYIQGLLSSYWEEQSAWLKKHQAQANADTQVTDNTLQSAQNFLRAQEQLEYWRDQYPELDDLK